MFQEAKKTKRRDFLGTGLIILGAMALGPSPAPAQPSPIAEKLPQADKGIPATEDLMREHGVLRRVLLIYEELHRRLQGGQDFRPEVLEKAAGIIRNFVEDYHEKLEEDFVFPLFEQAGILVDLVKVLKAQHLAGRQLTAYLLENAKPENLKDPGKRQGLATNLSAFWRMYRPHAAREDTVLFPAFRSIVPPQKFQELSEKFEQTEQVKFGKDGFARMVDEVGELENTLGIGDLSQFTPKF